MLHLAKFGDLSAGGVDSVTAENGLGKNQFEAVVVVGAAVVISVSTAAGLCSSPNVLGDVTFPRRRIPTSRPTELAGTS